MQKTLAIVSVLLFVLPASVLAAPDVMPPVITLFGGSVSVPQGTYSEPGYSAIDNVDGNITSNVSVGGLGSAPGNYTLSYNVSDAAGNPATTQTRSVQIYANGIANPCTGNGTCPCPAGVDPILGNAAAWKLCAIANYPKLADGSTLVCRLKPLQPGEHIQCAADQAGFGEMVIAKDGTETFR